MTPSHGAEDDRLVQPTVCAKSYSSKHFHEGPVVPTAIEREHPGLAESLGVEPAHGIYGAR